MEIERGESSGAACSIGARQQQVGAEADQRAHLVRLCVDDRTIEFIGSDQAVRGDPERPLAFAQCLLPLTRRTQPDGGDIVQRHLSELHIAARTSKQPVSAYSVACARAVCVALVCCSSPVQVK